MKEEKQYVGNNNAIKRALLLLAQSDKWELEQKEFDGMEVYTLNDCLTVVPYLRKAHNLWTGKDIELPPFTSKAEIMKILRQEIQATRHLVGQQKLSMGEGHK